MRGEVEVWSGDDLILKEANMLTDGAGELLADIMTVSPSLATIEDHATSSILDTSNYTIQAISFGTGSEGFRNKAHSLGAGEENYLRVGGPVSNNFLLGNIGLYTVATVDATSLNFQPEVGLPSSPDPTKTLLEENTSISASVGGVDVSSVVPGNGQHVNFMPSAIFSSIFAGTEFDDSASALVAASLLGSFPESTALPTGAFVQRVNGGATDAQSNPGGFFNTVSSMDASGFVNMVMSSVPNPGYTMSSTSSGLCLSANADFPSNGTVEYSVALSEEDLLQVHAYGGIYHLGLWTIDMQESLMNGNTPPFAFSVLDNPRKYRLFCRKGVSKDLTYIENISAYQDLTIKWRLHFL